MSGETIIECPHCHEKTMHVAEQRFDCIPGIEPFDIATCHNDACVMHGQTKSLNEHLRMKPEDIAVYARKSGEKESLIMKNYKIYWRLGKPGEPGYCGGEHDQEGESPEDAVLRLKADMRKMGRDTSRVRIQRVVEMVGEIERPMLIDTLSKLSSAERTALLAEVETSS